MDFIVQTMKSKVMKMVAIKDMEMPNCCAKCDFKEDYCFYCNKLQKRIPQSNFFDSRLPDCPLVEIEERKVSKWIVKNAKKQGYDIAGIKTWYIQIVCNECGFTETAIEGHTGQLKYCPCCGAEMRGVEDE